MNNHVTVLEIDSHALKHNLNYFKGKLHPETKILVVVKAFGYGSDAIEIAKLIQHDVDYFAVAYTDEGIALRGANIKTPILVLHPQIQNLKRIIEHQLEPNLYSFNILNAFIKIADDKLLLSYPIHIKFNTGLNRIGFLPADVPFVLAKIKTSNNIQVVSVFSHLSASDDLKEKEFTQQQINVFTKITTLFNSHLAYKPIVHLLNTSGIINYPKAQFDMVRLGIGLYGFANDEKETKKLQNVVSLTSIISQIHLIKPGESVGYNSTFTTDKSIKTATIPVGHADGISRKLGNGVGNVIINNKKAPFIGNVCMDMIMVDITAIDCKEGDKVILFDSQKMVKEIAEKTNTISYEVLTAISQRIKRLVKH